MDLRTRLLSFSGRMNRKTFLLTYLVLIVISLVVGAVLGMLDSALGTSVPVGNGTSGMGALSGLWNLMLIWPGLALTVKRLHDRERSGYFMLVVLIPVIGSIWVFVETFCLRGTRGPNRFGPDPLLPDAQAIGQVFT